MRGRREIEQPPALPGHDGLPQVVIVHEAAEQLRRVLEVLGRETDARPSKRLRDRARRVGQHRHVRRHRLDQRNAEPLVLAEGYVDVRMAVVARQLVVRNRPGEKESLARHPVGGDQRADRGMVARHHVGAAGEDHPDVRIDVALVVLGEPDVVLDSLVRREAPDEQDVGQLVVQDVVEHRLRPRVREALGVDRDRQHARRREPERGELAPVELRVAEREIDAADQAGELLPADGGDAEQGRVVRGEEAGGSDVVVLQHAPARQRRECLRHRRRQREVQDGDIARARRRVAERTDITAQVAVDRQREEARAMAAAPQHVAHAAGAVADCIAAMRRGHPLVYHHGDSQRSDPGSFGSAP